MTHDEILDAVNLYWDEGKKEEALTLLMVSVRQEMNLTYTRRFTEMTLGHVGKFIRSAEGKALMETIEQKLQPAGS